MHSKRIYLIILMLALVASTAYAQEREPKRYLSNSEDWRDVYSVMQYGALTQKTSNFLVSSRHATLITNQIPTGEPVRVFSSEDVPFVVGYESLLRGKGFDAGEVQSDNINFELAQDLPEINKFIILDDSYGYNAISVAPYASLVKSYVLFTDRDNINQIVDFLDTKQVEELLIYGQVDREVLEELERFNPDIINEEADRFRNNVEIVKRYRAESPAKQVILTNGEFIEQEIMTGSQPVVFIGTNNVPESVQQYIQGTDIEVGVLIGNELVGTATFIRRALGISVFVKFAQGARAPQGAISQVEALDMFYLPTYTINLEIENLKYNRATNQLEVTLKNTEDQGVYFLGTYTITGSDGSRQVLPAAGTNEVAFLDGNEIKTLVYEVEEPLPEGSITADVFVVYGESPGALERELRATLNVDSVTVHDACEVELDGVALTPNTGTFHVDVANIGDADCFVDVELIDLVIAGQRTTVSQDVATKIKAGKSRTIKIKVDDFEEADVEDNEQITVRAYYGERETSLVKFKDWQFEVTLKKGDVLFYSLLVIIIILLILVVWRRKKKKDGK